MKTLWILLISLAIFTAVQIGNADDEVDGWFRRVLAADVEDKRIDRRGESKFGIEKKKKNVRKVTAKYTFNGHTPRFYP